MRAGTLRHRIRIEAFTETQDKTTGRITQAWTEFCTVWGKHEALSTRDQLQAQAIDSSMTARCRIRSAQRQVRLIQPCVYIFGISTGKLTVIRCQTMKAVLSG